MKSSADGLDEDGHLPLVQQLVRELLCGEQMLFAHSRLLTLALLECELVDHLLLRAVQLAVGDQIHVAWRPQLQLDLDLQWDNNNGNNNNKD